MVVITVLVECWIKDKADNNLFDEASFIKYDYHTFELFQIFLYGCFAQ